MAPAPPVPALALDDAFPAGRWDARWIWSDAAADDATRRTVALRHVVHLDEVPASVPTRISAIARYALWVNGTEVSRGPIRANPRRARHDVVDLAPTLQVGPNVVTALVWIYPGANPFWMPGPVFASRLGRGGFVLEAAPGTIDLRTDATWRARLLDGWTNSTRPVGISGRPREVVDLRSLPATWTEPDLDHAGWAAAVTVNAMGHGEPGRQEPPNHPYGPFGPNPISARTPVDVALHLTDDGHWLSDRVVVGTLLLDVEGPAGSVVRVTAAERTGDGAIVADQEPIGVDLVLDGTRRTFETLDIYGLSALTVEVDDGGAVRGATVRERLLPRRGDATFACSDPLLDQVWAVGRRSVTICSLDAYVDCPTREQRAWAGDSVVHQMVDLTTNTDWSLARWHPLLTASPRADGMLPMAVAGDAEEADFTMIPDWALHWIHSVHNLYRYDGDADEVRRLLPVVENVIRWFDPFLDEHGTLTDVIGWVIIDWASVYTEGVCAALNGLYGRALLELAEMADWLGDTGRAEWARGAHQRLADGFERLWDPDRQRYVDSFIAGRARPMASQHGQAAAIVGRLAPPERWSRLVEVLTDEDDLVHATFGIADREATPGGNVSPGGGVMSAGHPEPWWDTGRQVVRAQPFFRYLVHDALADAGRSDLIPAQCRDWRWALERCDTSWSETWFGGTVSHGWSSTPTRDLMVRVLGVEPAEPGFARARIDPELGDLEWARGSVPCPAGLIDVAVDRASIEITSPIAFVHAGVHHDAGTHRIDRAEPVLLVADPTAGASS